MRQLHHPSIDDISVEGILHAFSDPVRVQIYLELANAECTKNCSTFLTMNKVALPKSTLSQHFKVLREAGLIHSERKGVEMHNRTRCPELKERYGEMITAILKTYSATCKKKKRR